MITCPNCGIDVLEHPANRCLDAWVAERIMGGDKPYIKEYSADIAAAFEIIEKMRHDYIFFMSDMHPLWCVYFAQFFPYQSNTDKLMHSSPKLIRIYELLIPVAICRAALLAVMECSES